MKGLNNMKNIVAVFAAALCIYMMAIPVFAVSVPQEAEVTLMRETVLNVYDDEDVDFMADPEIIESGSIVINPRSRSVHIEWVGPSDKGGDWTWGTINSTVIFSGLLTIAYQNRTSVKAGSNPIMTSGWTEVGDAAYVVDGYALFGGNKAYYDYK